ncbi:MAG TPA: hypothetical protein VEY91_06670 [Candidatus Limnocylindria bacterium]|nr:hypothetical protein [Candidatus Limnocylindria bacterium]
MIRSAALIWIVVAFAAAPALAQHDHSHAGHSHHGSTATVPTFEHIGNVHHEIRTSNPEAQRYFDQGLFLTYGFNHEEAIRAFEHVAHLDSTAAMAWWGVALANGPNINWPMDSTQEARANVALAKAKSLAVRHASEQERAYIDALATRYGTPAGADRAARDAAYARAMDALRKRYPDDLDAAALYAEAMLDLSPWNQWTLDGKPLPGTLETLEALESVLKRNPDHIGAIHYYIHAAEAGPAHKKAVPYAERLSKMPLDAGHLVHMPSHIFQRVGRYQESELDNIEASDHDSLYIAKWKPDGIYPMMYYPHNVHFVWAAASMSGRSRQAVHYARRLTALVPAEMVSMAPPMEFWCPTIYYALVRFAQWDVILKEPPPHQDLRFTRGIWHFARGQAYAGRGELERALAERDSVAAIAASTPADALVSFNSAKALLTIATHQLGAEVASKQGKADDAVRRLRQAIAIEDTLHYDEPPAWALPVRHSLGTILLAANRAQEAEAAFRADLERNPENGWSLHGLAQALRARKATADATEVEKRFRAAWARADVEPMRSQQKSR